MIRVTDFPYHLWAILSLILLISPAHLDQSSEYLDESSASVEEGAKNYTNLAIKEGFKHKFDTKNIDYAVNTDIEAKTYLDLVKRSNIFLDTSLFIEEVLKNYTSATTLLACPNKWGKTMNLDMLKTFLEIQVDQNGRRLPRDNTTTYRLFRHNEVVHNETFFQKLQSPLLISKKTVLVDRHQGKYPVVYFSLKEVVGDDVVSIRQRVRQALSRSFQQHSYLVQELTNNKSANFALFEEMLNGTAKDEDIPDGLILLCHTLEEYFNKKVVVLVDDYDAFVHHFLPSDKYSELELKEMINFVEKVVTWALRKNLHMEFGIATGILKINAFEWQLHNYTVFVNDRDTPISKYFGFTRSQVQQIFDMYEWPEYLVWRAHAWYQGYYPFANQTNSFFNPYSITHFFEIRKCLAYRDEGTNDEALIQNILPDNQVIRNEMLLLLSKGTLPVYKKHAFTIKDLDDIRVHGSRLITYLSEKGYLSKLLVNPVDKNLSQDPASIPNIEIAHQIAGWMKNYCKRQFNLDPLTFNWVGVRLRNFFENQTLSEQDIDKLLEKVYKNATHLNDKMNISTTEYKLPTQEHPVHLIFDCLCLRAQQETYYEYEFYFKKTLKADVVAINRHKKQAAIIELKFMHETPAEVMAQAEKYRNVVDDNAKEVETINFIGISVSSNFTVRVANKVVTKKALV